MVEYTLKILDDQTKNNIFSAESQPYPFLETLLLLQLVPLPSNLFDHIEK